VEVAIDLASSSDEEEEGGAAAGGRSRAPLDVDNFIMDAWEVLVGRTVKPDPDAGATLPPVAVKQEPVGGARVEEDEQDQAEPAAAEEEKEEEAGKQEEEEQQQRQRQEQPQPGEQAQIGEQELQQFLRMVADLHGGFTDICMASRDSEGGPRRHQHRRSHRNQQYADPPRP
jgi:hypothetical protein